MTVVSGSATIASASAVHGGRPETGSQSKARPLGYAAISDGAVRMDASLARAIVRLQQSGDVATKPVASDVIRAAGPHGRFVDAVQALRLTKAEASRLTPTRVAELKEAAKEVFSLTTGVPRAQSPIEVFEEQRLRELELRRESTISERKDRVSDSDQPPKVAADAQSDRHTTYLDTPKPVLPEPVILPESEFAADQASEQKTRATRPESAVNTGTGEPANLTSAVPEGLASGETGGTSTD